MALEDDEEIEMLRRTVRGFVVQSLRRHEADVDAADEIPADLIKGLTVTFNAQSYTNKAKNQVVEQGKYQIDTAKTPWTIDFAIEKGTDAGKRQLGIFTIDGETLTLSVAESRAMENSDDRNLCQSPGGR